MKTLILLLWLGVSLPAAAQPPLEIIPLRHRTVEQVLPLLRPLLEPGGTLTGDRGQLIVRTSPGNLAELRRALAAVDQPGRRLMISVRFDDAAAAQRQELGVSGRVGERGSRIGVRGNDTRNVTSEQVDQRIQVLEGGRAFIATGQAVPVSGGVWETATGFEAVARLSGDRVFVEVAPQRESFEHQQRVVSTVSARLGEWFEVGGSTASAARDGRGILGGQRSTAAHTWRVWLRVEALP